MITSVKELGLQITCPVCKSQPNQSCVGIRGKTRYYNHVARNTLALKSISNVEEVFGQSSHTTLVRI